MKKRKIFTVRAILTFANETQLDALNEYASNKEKAEKFAREDFRNIYPNVNRIDIIEVK